MELNQADLAKLDKRYRANFFNTLTGFKSANLIGTYDENDKENLAIFNSVIHLGANPPLMGFILRPTTVERHTYENIKKQAFIPSIISTKLSLKKPITLLLNTH